ncbi:hypothetical protein [Sphingobium sp. B8D3D]|nr:hypothetical protein [Sphingobium sp. B8D3D]MCW2413464.1 hypothetical protein [Sphingobium sp. B8D3D]MCW2414237.1 hypothetical protein [Sphingobium sp. B8D3A]
MAKPPKPSNGSWRIVPLTLTEPLKVTVGDKMTPILEQRLVPEAAVLTSTAVQYGSYLLTPDAALIRVTTKQGTAWCSIDPLRTHPGNPKTSFGEALLMGRKIVERRESPCFADTNGDGLMDSAMIGSERGYVVPTIDKLGKPTPVTPFAVRETDAAAVISYPLVLQAELTKPKNEAPSLIFSLSVSSKEYSSQITGFRLVGGPDDRTSFAGFSGLATIETKFEEPVPALYTLGSISEDGNAVVTITQTISARRFTLGDILTF